MIFDISKVSKRVIMKTVLFKRLIHHLWNLCLSRKKKRGSLEEEGRGGGRGEALHIREDTHKKWHGPLSHCCREGKT